MTALAPADAEILAFERTRFRYPALKADAILRRFSVSETRYYQRLTALTQTPEALAYDPELVQRLERIRRDRAAQRGATA